MPLSFASRAASRWCRSNEQEPAVTGDQKTQEPQSRDQHPSQHTTREQDSDNTAQQRSKGRRPSGSGNTRKNNYQFDDQLEHDICQLVIHIAPESFPVHNRPELTTMPPVEVARTDRRILFCDCRHPGPHIWPNGDEVD